MNGLFGWYKSIGNDTARGYVRTFMLKLLWRQILIYFIVLSISLSLTPEADVDLE
jgi:hypothetical protein